jgi:uncharacterized protein
MRIKNVTFNKTQSTRSSRGSKQMKTGTATLPLHWGKAPPWLFSRMQKLAREIILIMLRDYGSQEILNRLSDPFWFQAFGCVLGFDWHSSGLTTTVCGALKEALRGIEHETGFFAAGGKGRVSRKTPDEITGFGDALQVPASSLVYASRMSAKVDSAAVQDGYQLYHHVFFFTAAGAWAVVQQGLNYETRYARRYHWLSTDLSDFVCEPHKAVCCDSRGETLNLVAREGADNRTASCRLAVEHPDRVLREVTKMTSLDLPARHHVTGRDIHPEKLRTILLKTYEAQPANFEALMSLRGIGPKALRSLALLSELIYGAAPSFKDPARYSYAHGGKDGHPYPVARDVYDGTIQFLKEIVNESNIEPSDKKKAFRQLAVFCASG